MKKNKIMILGALLLTLVATSCHEDADPMVAYAFDDNQSWAEARSSYAGKFRVFWKAMNQNYTLWDYEKSADWTGTRCTRSTCRSLRPLTSPAPRLATLC